MIIIQKHHYFQILSRDSLSIARLNQREPYQLNIHMMSIIMGLLIQMLKNINNNLKLKMTVT